MGCVCRATGATARLRISAFGGPQNNRAGSAEAERKLKLYPTEQMSTVEMSKLQSAIENRAQLEKLPHAEVEHC